MRPKRRYWADRIRGRIPDDFITLCDALHESQAAIAVLDRLDRDDLKQRSIRHAVVIQFADELVAQQRYEAIIEIMDDVAVWVARQRQDILWGEARNNPRSVLSYQ